LYHVDVAVDGCEVQGGEAVSVLDVDPCAQLVLEGGVVAGLFHVLTCEGLEVQHVDLEFGQFIFEGCEVKQGRPALVLHEGEVELGTLF
jgi:hypothetical protein